EMRGNRIGTESVQHEHIEFSIRLLLDRQPAVSDDDIARIRASAKIREEIVCNRVNLQVDVEERDVPVGTCPSSHASGSESDNTDVLIGPRCNQVHDVANWSGLVIVGQRLAAQHRIHAFHAMKRVTVQKLAHVAVEIEDHFLDAEEIAVDVQHL